MAKTYRTGGVKAPRPPMAAASTVRQEMALQDLRRTELRGNLFDFSKTSRLRDVFPPSSAGGQLVPRELDPTVQLFHPAIGGGGMLDQMRSFLISGAAGVSQVEGSEIPAGQVFYMPYAAAFHDDAAARRVRYYIRHVATNRFVGIQDSAFDPNVTVIPQNQGYPLLRAILVPPGWLIGAEFFAIGAGNIGNLQGCGAVLSLADHPPALY